MHPNAFHSPWPLRGGRGQHAASDRMLLSICPFIPKSHLQRATCWWAPEHSSTSRVLWRPFHATDLFSSLLSFSVCWSILYSSIIVISRFCSQLNISTAAEFSCKVVALVVPAQWPIPFPHLKNGKSAAENWARGGEVATYLVNISIKLGSRTLKELILPISLKNGNDERRRIWQSRNSNSALDFGYRNLEACAGFPRHMERFPVMSADRDLKSITLS